jgi:phosphoribosylpyrophosphate synthetase
MIETAGTIYNGVELVNKRGANRIHIYGGHPTLAGDTHVHRNPAWNRMARMIEQFNVEAITFLDTISRDGEHEIFEFQYGEDTANRVNFITVQEMLYNHVTRDIASHSAMQMEVM